MLTLKRHSIGLMAIPMLFLLSSCDKELASIQEPTTETPLFTSKMHVYDHTGDQSVEVLISSKSKETLDAWKEENELSLHFDALNYDTELNSADYTSDTEEILPSDNETNYNYPFVSIDIKAVNAEDRFNAYHLKVTNLKKKATSLDKMGGFNTAQEFKLDKRWHNGKICWSEAAPNDELSNTIHYSWSRKWRQFFRKWSYLKSGNLNSLGECSEVYYHGYRLKISVLSNFRNFTISQRKDSNSTWERLY